MIFPKIRWSTTQDSHWYTIIAEISIGSARYKESHCITKEEVEHSYMLDWSIERMQNNILDVLGEADKDDVCSYDIEKMQASIDSGTIKLPSGLTREGRRKWIRDNMGKLSDD